MNTNIKNQFRISPSTIGSLLECPRCLWLFYREGLKRPEGIFPSLPRGMDEIVKDYFDKYRSANKLPPEVAGKIEGRLFDDTEKLNQWRNRKNGLAAEFPEFNMILKGLIDDLLITTDNKYIPFDFKTRGFAIKENTHLHYQIQLDLYALLFDKNGLSPANHGYLLFFYPISYEKNYTQFETELVKMEVSHKRGYATLKKVYQIITGPLPPPQPECSYCYYRRFQPND
ncbi:MAG: PD-(D/E)XK nuclease family protein [Minisyncoccales bacterium]